jgi:SAM-dependent methyltransferase
LNLIQSIDKKDLILLYDDSFKFDISDQFKELKTINYYKCDNCKLEFFDSKAAGDEFFYEKLQQHRKVYYNPDRKEFQFAKKHISETDLVLEIGSGNGNFAKGINNYKGLEFNDKAIFEAKKDGILLLKESIEDFSNLNKSKFDVVCSFHVLEHVKDPYSFLKSAISTLKIGGRLIISVPCNDSIFTGNLNHVLNLPPHHISRWRIENMKYLRSFLDLKLESFEISSISSKIDKNAYSNEMITHFILRLIYPKNKTIISNIKIKIVRKIIYKISMYIPLHKFFSCEDCLGENMTFVYVKE